MRLSYTRWVSAECEGRHIWTMSIQSQLQHLLPPKMAGEMWANDQSEPCPAMNIFPITGEGPSTHLISILSPIHLDPECWSSFLHTQFVLAMWRATMHKFYLLNYCVINLLMFKPWSNYILLFIAHCLISYRIRMWISEEKRIWSDDSDL